MAAPLRVFETKSYPRWKEQSHNCMSVSIKFSQLQVVTVHFHPTPNSLHHWWASKRDSSLFFFGTQKMTFYKMSVFFCSLDPCCFGPTVTFIIKPKTIKISKKKGSHTGLEQPVLWLFSCLLYSKQPAYWGRVNYFNLGWTISLSLIITAILTG